MSAGAEDPGSVAPGAPWVALRARPRGDREAVLAALFEVGSQGVHEDGDALVTHFPPGTDVEVLRAAVLAADATADVVIGPAEQVDWTEGWKALITAHELGGLVVSPPWLAEGRDPARTIVIEPGMAFGTGDHATTRGVVRLMQGVVRAGDTVADLGAGSAVLAIAAAKLGATRVVAIEMDPEAISNAEENVERNGVGDEVSVLCGDAHVLLPLVAPVRVVLANIISSVLVGLLPTIEHALSADGVAILSGILVEERAHMLATLEATGWRVEAEDAEDVWWSARIARR
jgi:ribosomal protein L11 methyltransferase